MVIDEAIVTTGGRPCDGNDACWTPCWIGGACVDGEAEPGDGGGVEP
jgi:hypothetical protein